MKTAEYPERECRLILTEDGLTDHACDLPELHPGPCAPSTLPPALARRAQWEQDNPGWERMISRSDPFAEARIPGEKR